jgi:hypothetical protein
LILLPNSPQAGSDMLNNMVASFSASNQVGEMMKKAKRVKPKTDNHPSDYQALQQAPEEPETEV